LRNVIKNLLRWANITKSSDDSARYPIQQLSYLGKVADSIILFPYGMHANIPAENIVLMFSAQGHEENRAALPIAGPGRPKLKSGEVAIFNKESGSVITLKQSGEIEITAPSGVTVAGNLTVNGNVQVNGNLTVTGDTALGANVTSNSINIGSTHTHSGVTSGPSNTGPPI
jgi:phage gp45-like